MEHDTFAETERGRSQLTGYLTGNGCLGRLNIPVFLEDAAPQRSKDTERDSVRQLISQFILDGAGLMFS